MLDSTLNKPDTNEEHANEIDINDVKISKLPSFFANLRDIFIYLCTDLTTLVMLIVAIYLSLLYLGHLYLFPQV